MPFLFRQLTIAGVGLIGSSFALCAREQRLIERIVGLGRTQANLDTAIERNIIDYATRDPAEAARGAELVMLATPVMTFPSTFAAMRPHLPADAVITDVGSVKGWVVTEIEPLLGPAMAFVGVHPVAGKETTGAAAADPDLYRGRRVIVTPSERSTPEAIEKVETLWRATGANVERMAPETHDAILAHASHLPQIVSSALAAALADQTINGRWAAGFGAGGLRDTTRIAASSAEMWRDICLTNRDAILSSLRVYTTSLAEFIAAVQAGDGPGLIELFQRGRKMRERLN
jgi:prephenate dehydrogenase